MTTNLPPEALPLVVTPEDHEAGFKSLDVQLRSGKHDTLRLKAPAAIRAQPLLGRLARGEDITLELLNLCEPYPPNVWERIAVEEFGRLFLAAWGLAYGAESQKKMLAAGAAAGGGSTPG